MWVVAQEYTREEMCQEGVMLPRDRLEVPPANKDAFNLLVGNCNIFLVVLCLAFSLISI